MDEKMINHEKWEVIEELMKNSGSDCILKQLRILTENNLSVQMVIAESICGEMLFIWQWLNTKEFKPNHSSLTHTHYKQSFQLGPIANNKIVQFFWEPQQGIKVS